MERMGMISLRRLFAGFIEFVCFFSNGTEAKCRGWNKGLILENDLTNRVISLWKVSRSVVPVPVQDELGPRWHL
jgi:hypothetical protein